METKTALVTGGSGYLGSVVSKKLKSEGWTVICLDTKKPKHNYYDWHFEYDITDANLVNLVFQESQKIDAVFHFAGRIEVGESMKDPTEFWETNVAGTVILLNAMKFHGVDNIIFSSTAGLYWAKDYPLLESDCITNNHVYGNTKAACESAIRDSGLKHIIFRYFNLAGAEDDVGENHVPETHLIPKILQNLNNVEVYGADFDTKDGSCVRDYVHVSDVADAHLSGLKYLLKGGNSETINLGSGKGHSVFEIIDIIRKELKLPVEYKVKQRRAGDPASLIADITLAKRLLHYRPKHDILSILKSAYEWNEKTYEK